MALDLVSALAAYIPRDRVEHILNPEIPLAQDGVALIADISGFTPLTEALTHGLRPDQGAEELTRALEAVFTPLIQEVHNFRGSVIKFGGDALIVWYGRAKREHRRTVVRRALTAADHMQRAIDLHGRIATPIGTITLQMKIGLAYGSARRFKLGVEAFGYEDVIAGATLDLMAAAEHHAEPGDVMVAKSTFDLAADAFSVAAWRGDFAAVDKLLKPARPHPWPPLQWDPAAEDNLVDALSPYVPALIQERLKADRRMVAELKSVVSLFVQFHGLDYDHDPRIEPRLQTYFSLAQRVVNWYDGRLNRLITGDKGSLLHIIFGAPKSVENQEARAIRCALDLQRECGTLSFITMQRIGVTAGRVFAGPVGSPVRHDYTVMGDSINLSARLMQNAAADQTLMDATVREMLGQAFSVRDLGAIEVKGKGEPVRVFAALGAEEQTRRKRPQKLQPIFGRDKDLAVIRQRVRDLERGRGSIVTLIGKVGMGKTLMLDTLRAETEARWRVRRGRWLSGISLAYGDMLSGYLFIDLLRDLLDLPPNATPEETNRRLYALCAETFGPPRVDATYPYIARFMGLSLPADMARRLEGITGESLRWRLFEIVPELFELLSERTPVVISLDDLQWADPTSLRLVEALLPLATRRPILLLLSMRPREEPKLVPLKERVETLAAPPIPQTFSAPVEITMDELEATDARPLIRHHGPNIPPHIVDYLLEKGGGNPLFLVELVRTLAARGLLAPDVRLEDVTVEALDLPNSVQGLLLAQLDRLAADARHTLQMASVIGRTFLDAVLIRIAEAEQAVEAHIAALEGREFIVETDPTDLGRAHAFRHILIQESAYGTLLYERRRAYHRRVAETLEELFPLKIADQSGILARHYERAGDLAQALYYHQQTADQARLLYAHEEAEALYQKILVLLDQQAQADPAANLEQRAKTHLKIAQVHANRMDFTAAQTHYERAFDLFEQQDARREAGRERDTVTPQPPLRWGILEQYARNFDPGTADLEQTVEIIENLFEGLVELDADLNVVPAVAKRWAVRDGGQTYRFELRPGLKWSDGTPLTADDFVFAWRRNLDPRTQSAQAHQLFVVAGAEEFHAGRAPASAVGVRALDNLTLEIKLKAPVGYFLYLLTQNVAFPQPRHVVRPLVEAWATPRHLVCNGFFQTRAHPNGNRLSLIKNPHYKGFAEGNLTQVNLRFVQPDFEAYRAGQTDWCLIEAAGDIPQRQLEEALLIQYLAMGFVAFACHGHPFQSVHARRAFAHAVDKKRLVETVWSDVQKAANGGIVPSGMPGHSPEIGLRFDPALAQESLQRAREEGDRPWPELILATFPGFDTTPAFLRENWQTHLGVRVQIVKDMTVKEMLAALKKGEIHMLLLSYHVGYPDPDDILRALFHSGSAMNYFGWRNAEFDRLVEQALNAADSASALESYHAADKILVRAEAAVIPLYYQQAYGLLREPYALASANKILRGGKMRLKNVRIDESF